MRRRGAKTSSAKASQLTVRGLSPALQSEIRRLADQEGISLNKAALRLLERGAGIERPKGQPQVIGNALDGYIGTWSEEDEKQVLEAIRSCEQVDPDFWR